MKTQIRLWTPYYITVFKFIYTCASSYCFGQAISGRWNARTANPRTLEMVFQNAPSHVDNVVLVQSEVTWDGGAHVDDNLLAVRADALAGCADALAGCADALAVRADALAVRADALTCKR